MSIRRSVAAAVAVATMTAGLGVLGATSASAANFYEQYPGDVYLLKNNVAGLAAATPADQVTGGTYAGLPFTSVAVDGACPAPQTASVNVYVRLQTTGPESSWVEVPLTSSKAPSFDANGDMYVTGPFNNFKLAAIQNFLAGTPQTLPLAVACFDAGSAVIGHFATAVSLAATSDNSGTWSQIDPPTIEVPLTPTTTTLGTIASPVEAGDPVSLSATVDPSAATGSIEYFAGAASLGTSPIGTPLVVGTLGVGTHSITAKYLGDTTYAGSTSSAGSVEVTEAADRTTTTTLGVDITSGAPYQNVTLSATVNASKGTAVGQVAFLDGATVLATVALTGATNEAEYTFNPGLGTHSFTASFTGTDPYLDSASDAVPAEYVVQGASTEANVKVNLTGGAITITTPYVDSASALDLGQLVLDSTESFYTASAEIGSTTDPAQAIKVTDQRAGTVGWTAQVQVLPFTVSDNGSTAANESFSGQFAGLTGLAAGKPSGNGLNLADLTLTDHAAYSDGLETFKTFAEYEPSDAQYKLGTALIGGTFSLDHVPTSLVPGTYWATIVFTAN